MKSSRAFRLLAATFASTAAAQTTPAPREPAAAAGSDASPVVLSPFEVTTSKDVGYAASNTLAGTRLNAELWETPAAISVFTKEFMADAGLLNMRDALDYALNSSEEFTDYTGLSNLANDITAQIRGFVGGAVGRNYFQWRLVNIDRFNLERIDLSRGPNSVLFGIGAPGGIINASTKRARFGRDVNEVGVRYGSWSDQRGELDVGRTLVRDRLAVRANFVAQDKGDWREFNRFRPTASDRTGVVTANELNPNFGKFYAQTGGQLAVTDRKTDDFRLTGSYRLDLTKQRHWLGRHELAGLLSRSNIYTFDDSFASQNVTPAGNAQYPLDLTNGNNQILRRVYVDFSSADPHRHGLFDPRKHPLTGQNGVTEGFVRTGDSARDNLSQLDTRMLVLQSRWLNNSVILTGGLRNDRRRIWSDTADFNGNGSTNDERDPVTRLYPRRIRTDVKQFAQGDTKTFGAVVCPFGWKWLALAYNQSDSFQPQAALDINDRALGNRRGAGTDYSVRLRLWDNKLNVDNVLNETDPIVTDTDQSEDYRYVLQTPRRSGLSATLTF